MEQLALLGIVLSFSGRAKPVKRGEGRQLGKGAVDMYNRRQFPQPEWGILAVGRSVLAGWERIAAGSWPTQSAVAGTQVTNPDSEEPSSLR